jgi:hypothetical protein
MNIICKLLGHDFKLLNPKFMQCPRCGAVQVSPYYHSSNKSNSEEKP